MLFLSYWQSIPAELSWVDRQVLTDANSAKVITQNYDT